MRTCWYCFWNAFNRRVKSVSENYLPKQCRGLQSKYWQFWHVIYTSVYVNLPSFRPHLGNLGHTVTWRKHREKIQNMKCFDLTNLLRLLHLRHMLTGHLERCSGEDFLAMVERGRRNVLSRWKFELCCFEATFILICALKHSKDESTLDSFGTLCPSTISISWIHQRQMNLTSMNERIHPTFYHEMPSHLSFNHLHHPFNFGVTSS